jgi:hypothetical protein
LSLPRPAPVNNIVNPSPVRLCHFAGRFRRVGKLRGSRARTLCAQPLCAQHENVSFPAGDEEARRADLEKACILVFFGRRFDRPSARDTMTIFAPDLRVTRCKLLAPGIKELRELVCSIPAGVAELDRAGVIDPEIGFAEHGVNSLMPSAFVHTCKQHSASIYLRLCSSTHRQ